MKHGSGDKVKVRSDLVVGETYGADGFIDSMAAMKGKVATIKEVFEDAGKYTIIEHRWSWTDEMFEGLADGEKTLKAYDVMKLAAEKPQEYEGKRYKVVDGGACDFCGTKYKEMRINRYGQFCYGSAVVYVSTDTILEEIPQPVPFMEALNSRKKIKYFDWDNYYSPSGVMKILATNTNDTILRLINDNQWLIEA